MENSDLQVDFISDSLKDKRVDVVVSGSIGAVESVRFIRSLRRLGSSVYAILSQGGSQFTTTTALEWASANKVITDFEGLASHIATGDACVVAPSSANMLAKVARGITDCPASALIASYLGAKKPVLIVPNMHNSLLKSPIVGQNLSMLSEYCVVLGVREEEGKAKFPAPDVLADLVSHHINRQGTKRPDVLVAMGSTKGYFDDIRYVSNYSSGALGSKIAEETFRQGCQTHVVVGACPIRPKTFTSTHEITSNDDLESACKAILQGSKAAVVFASSVLDFVPETRLSGKVKSSEHDELSIRFVKTKKILANLDSPIQIKVGFKLESQLTDASARSLAETYCRSYQLSYMVLNQLSDVSSSGHKAFLAEYDDNATLTLRKEEGKETIAANICRHIISRYERSPHS